MGINDIVNVYICIHSIRYWCLFLLLLPLMCTNSNKDTIVLKLDIQSQDGHAYKCKIPKSNIIHSKFITDFIVSNDAKYDEGHGLEIALPCDQDKQFFRIGFDDMCVYFQNDNLNQDYSEYKLPMPLLLNNPNDFYYDQIQLTQQEIIFMKHVESFDNNNNNNNNPFNIDMTKMDNLFKIAEFLEVERLLTIIAARQSSLMINMNKQEMIKWLMKNSNNNNNNIDNKNECNNDSAKMVPLFLQRENKNQECRINMHRIHEINEIKKYNGILLSKMLPFFSCFDINTFASISKQFYNFAMKWWNIIRDTIDPMIKILTKNEDATCLSLTNQEIVFYKPFLTLPQNKWSENQTGTYNQLQTMDMTTNQLQKASTNTNNLDLQFTTLAYINGKYRFQTLKVVKHYYYHQIQVSTGYSKWSQDDQTYFRFSGISFKFGKFDQQLNKIAQSESIQNIAIIMEGSQYLSSFNDLVGINDINNIKTIKVTQHSFPFIDFEQIYNVISINSKIDSLTISTNTFNTRKIMTLKNTKLIFLSQMNALTVLDLSDNGLYYFDFDILKQITNLQHLDLSGNVLSYKFDTHCLDFTFLNHVPNLRYLNLENNKIECIDNLMAIKKHPKLETLYLNSNKISLLELNAFQRTNFKEISLSFTSLRYDDTSKSQSSCLDFNSFKNIPQLEKLYIEGEIQCVVNFASIQKHRELQSLGLHNINSVSNSLLDFTKFHKSKAQDSELLYVSFNGMNLKYRMNNNKCVDLQFLKFMPFVRSLDLSNNKIECVDNLAFLRNYDGMTNGMGHLYLNNNNLLSFDFADLIGVHITYIYLTNNNLSTQSLKNFDDDTLSEISDDRDDVDIEDLNIYITKGNNVKLPLKQQSSVKFW